MKKYWLVVKNTWDEVFTYRLNFTMWRVRNILTFLTLYYLWYALLPEGSSLFGYNQSTILTYILGTALLQAIILSSRSYAIADEINQGNLSNYLLKPLSYFKYWFAKDLGDKAMNIAFASLELALLFIILHPPLMIQADIIILFFFFVTVLNAILIFFFFNIILGMIGFWSNEVWAPRFIFMVLLGFFSGGYFPLDILPQKAFSLFKALPFQYLLYFPLKIYLGQLSYLEIISGILISSLWIIVLYILIDKLWEKGLAVYTAQGR